MQQTSLFENVKYCSYCGRPLAADYEKEVCPGCQEQELFSRVKDFIRSRDVTEYQVAEEFQIPIRKVKAWIREGRIEYKELAPNTIKELRCASCGEPIQFGTLCQKCYKLKSTPKSTVFQKNEDSKIRFLEKR